MPICELYNSLVMAVLNDYETFNCFMFHLLVLVLVFVLSLLILTTRLLRSIGMGKKYCYQRVSVW